MGEAETFLRACYVGILILFIRLLHFLANYLQKSPQYNCTLAWISIHEFCIACKPPDHTSQGYWPWTLYLEQISWVNLNCLLKQFLVFCLSYPLVITVLFCPSLSLTNSDIWYKWNSVVHILLCLTSMREMTCISTCVAINRRMCASLLSAPIPAVWESSLKSH